MSSVDAKAGEVGHEGASVAADDEDDLGLIVDPLQADDLLQQGPALDMHWQHVKTLQTRIPNGACKHYNGM